MGAWIETPVPPFPALSPAVAPYVGAWIETHRVFRVRPWPQSHPTWVRGLKLFNDCNDKSFDRSHPTWVRGLKQADAITPDGADCRTLRGCVD